MNPDSPAFVAASRAPSPPACKRVMAVLSADSGWDDLLCGSLEEVFGRIDHRGTRLPFDTSLYYAGEMGARLWRGWISFRGPADPAALPDWKRAARDLENRLARDGRRTCNLDAGYLDSDKLVLASYKPGPFKLYLGAGVWADMILGYSRGVFTPLPGAFPDFRDGRYDKTLGIIRDKLKAEMRR